MFGHLSDIHEKQQLFLDFELGGGLVQESSKITMSTPFEHEAQRVRVFRIHTIRADYTGRSARSYHDLL